MAPKLKVEIRETVTLNNNNKYDAYNRFTLEGINHVDKRTIRVNTGGTEIIALSGSGVTQVYKEEDVRYMRFTNLSSVHPIMLTLKNENSDSFVTKIGEGLSFIYSGDHNQDFPNSGSGVINTFDANESTPLDINATGYAGLGDLVNIVAKASGSAAEYAQDVDNYYLTGSVYNVDMEIFIAAI